nr:CD109 antigen-like [Aedes albopictus]
MSTPNPQSAPPVRSGQEQQHHTSTKRQIGWVPPVGQAYPLEEAIKNLGDLIQVPSVCGEENIVRLAHNIVIYDYLKETETEEKPINWQAKAYLTEGLQSQLKCRRKDGSFSGSKNSEKGCTFLTAFVVKSLRIAAKYVDVQKAIVNDAFDWLIKKQLPDGQFLEVGTIIHPEMQGLISSNSSRFALTAYVLVALVENQEVREKYRMNVDLTADYLRNNFDIIENEYDLSLVTYAFFLINDHQKDNFLNKLLETSLYYRYTKERYWSEEPVQMEIVGYAVLTYLLDERVPDATPIVRWLKMQRYDNGGFARTQDTFVGLKALAAFARLTSAKMNDYRIIVSSENKYKNYVVMRTFNVNHSQLPQITTLDYFRKLYVAVEGIGYGLIHLAYQYYQNVMISNQYAKYAFTLDVQELTTTVNDALHLKICAGYNEKPDRERSDMTRVDVFLPSGFILEKDAVEDITKQIQLVHK